jgi:superfamily II DNA/RNA helicase
LTDTTAAPVTPTLKTFSDFGVDASICDALADAGIVNPFPIQELTLQLAIAGADLIGQARTGTGKTLAFGIPLLQRIDPATRGAGPRALVVVPTRELCLQVRDDLAIAGARKGVEVLPVYGGKSIDEQVDALAKGVDVVVGTPGRLLDLLRRGTLTLSTVSGLVLDEADEMLDLGFLPDVEQLIQATAADRQTLLFSATMPSAVVALARRYMNKPTFMRADVEEVRIAPETAQHFFSCHRMDKPAVLARILQDPSRGLCVVFSRTKRMADILVEDLRSQGVNAAAIHSDLRQDARERALKSFRAGKTDVLVATEVAARGLDISDVTHVVNYDCPDDEKMYLHRIGRTGRAGAAGVAITMALWNEAARLEMIKKALGISEPTHEVFSTSPILDELFNLPPREARTASTPSKPRAAKDADDSAEGKSSRPSGRSRGGRGRKRSGAEASDSDTGAGTKATDTKATDAKAAGRRDADTKARTADPKATKATTTDAPADTAAETGEVIRRVRTRTRSGDSTPRPAAAPPPSTDTGDEAADVRDDTSTTTERPSRRRDSGGGRSDREPRSTAGRRSSGEARRSDESRSSGTPRGSEGTRDARARRRTERSRPARPEQRREGQRRQRPAAPVDSDAARGTGRPRLSRPLVISYLP